MFQEDNDRERVLTEEEITRLYEEAALTLKPIRNLRRSAITGHRTDKVFARYHKPSLETLRAVVEGSPRTAGVTLVSRGPGLNVSTVLSA